MSSNGLKLQIATWANQQIDSNQTLILLAIADHLGQNETAWPGLETLTKKTKLSRSTVIRTVAALEKDGFLRKETRPGTSNVYTPCIDALENNSVRETPLIVSGRHYNSVTVTPLIVSGRHPNPPFNCSKNVPPNPEAGKAGVGSSAPKAKTKTKAGDSESPETQNMFHLLLSLEQEAGLPATTRPLHKFSAVLISTLNGMTTTYPWISDPTEQKTLLAAVLRHEGWSGIRSLCWGLLSSERYLSRVIASLEDCAASLQHEKNEVARIERETDSGFCAEREAKMDAIRSAAADHLDGLMRDAAAARVAQDAEIIVSESPVAAPQLLPFTTIPVSKASVAAKLARLDPDRMPFPTRG